MELEIQEQTSSFTRIALTGRLDTVGVDKIGTRVNAALAGGTHGIIDLSGVTFLASLGIRLLLTAAKMLDRRGYRLVLVAPQPVIAQALRHSSLDELIPVAPDLGSALALLDL
jgi:anti-anti-sigma factor